MTAPIITVFGSSSAKTPQRYLDLSFEIGAAIGRKGWTLRNGAGENGCMGATTDGALSVGGRVEGVNLRYFVDQGFVHPRLNNSQLRIADTMRDRKAWLGEGVSAFLVLPGGRALGKSYGKWPSNGRFSAIRNHLFSVISMTFGADPCSCSSARMKMACSMGRHPIFCSTAMAWLKPWAPYPVRLRLTRHHKPGQQRERRKQGRRDDDR